MGVTMAVRAALLGNHEPAAVMLLGDNIPPEHEKLGKMKKAHIARGSTDRRFSPCLSFAFFFITLLLNFCRL